MMDSPSRTTGPASGALKTILTAGLLAGLLDGLDAVVFIGWANGIPVERVFQFIASGAIGTQSFHGGSATAALGVFFHFTIAIGAAAVFYLISIKLPVIMHRPWLWGPVYGIGVFLCMHYLVVPLSAAPKQRPLSAGPLANLLFSHIFLVGIPIAFMTSSLARSHD